jgi:hypothetical protein
MTSPVTSISDKDYLDAIRNPQISFTDPFLKTGAAPTYSKQGSTVTRLYSNAGTFTLTVKFEAGQSLWAIRCFKQEHVPTDLALRYTEITQFIRDNKTPFLVHIEYQPIGLRVNSVLRPICKMEWVEGDGLIAYLDKHRHDSTRLKALPEKFLRVIMGLAQLKCAHGDLQHGNIMVANDQLVLIDYDGMYVPGYNGKGFGATETGHFNYVHKGRNASQFDDRLDRFSAISIYLSFCVIAREPSLFNEKEEALYFKKDDHHQPDQSARIAKLESLGYRDAAAEFRKICKGTPTAIPTLREFLLKCPSLLKELPAATVALLNDPNAVWVQPTHSAGIITPAAPPPPTRATAKVLPAAPLPPAPKKPAPGGFADFESAFTSLVNFPPSSPPPAPVQPPPVSRPIPTPIVSPPAQPLAPVKPAPPPIVQPAPPPVKKPTSTAPPKSPVTYTSSLTTGGGVLRTGVGVGFAAAGVLAGNIVTNLSQLRALSPNVDATEILGQVAEAGFNRFRGDPTTFLKPLGDEILLIGLVIAATHWTRQTPGRVTRWLLPFLIGLIVYMGFNAVVYGSASLAPLWGQAIALCVMVTITTRIPNIPLRMIVTAIGYGVVSASLKYPPLRGTVSTAEWIVYGSHAISVGVLAHLPSLFWRWPQPVAAGSISHPHNDNFRALVLRAAGVGAPGAVGMYATFEAVYQQNAVCSNEGIWLALTSILPSFVIGFFVSWLILRPMINQSGVYKPFMRGATFTVLGSGIGGVIAAGLYLVLTGISGCFLNFSVDALQANAIQGTAGIAVSAAVYSGFVFFLSARTGNTRTEHTFQFARRMMYLTIFLTLLLVVLGGQNRLAIDQVALNTLLVAVGAFLGYSLWTGIVWWMDSWARD